MIGGQVLRKRIFVFLSLVLFFFFLVSLRAVHLTSDPPARLSWSGGLYGDEPAYAHNARNKAVFGKWVLDEWNPFLYNPILTFSDYLSFRIFGTGFLALRMVALFWGMLSLIFIYVTFRRKFKKLWFAVLGVFLVETNYFFLMYTRLSLSDTMLTNWMLLALFLWAVGTEKSWVRFLSGLSAVAVFSCKPTAIYFAAVIGLAYLFTFARDREGGWRWKPFFLYIVPYLTGFGIGMGIWFVVYYLPFHAQIARYSREWSNLSMPRGVGDFLERTLGGHAPIAFKHFAWFPYVLLAGWLYLPISAFRLLRKWRSVNPLECLALAWFVLGYFALSGFRYRPPRYFVSLVPPTIMLALCGLNYLAGLASEESHPPLGWYFWVPYAAWVGLTAFLTKKYLHFDTKELYLGGAALAVWMGIWMGRWARRRTASFRGVVGYGGVVVLVVLALSHNGRIYVDWARRPAYKEVRVSRAVGKLVSGETIAGLWSPMVCMENDNRALCIAPGWFNDRDPYGRYHFPYLFLWRGNRDAELSMVRRVLGKRFLKTRLKPVARFSIKNAWAYLFKVTTN